MAISDTTRALLATAKTPRERRSTRALGARFDRLRAIARMLRDRGLDSHQITLELEAIDRKAHRANRLGWETCEAIAHESGKRQFRT